VAWHEREAGVVVSERESRLSGCRIIDEVKFHLFPLKQEEHSPFTSEGVSPPF
jgi:hypothetical protein